MRIIISTEEKSTFKASVNVYCEKLFFLVDKMKEILPLARLIVYASI